MSNQINSKNAPKTYDAGDLADVYSCAESDMQWMNIAIADVKKRIKEIKNELGNKNIIGFYALEQVLEMYEYVSETRLNYHAEEAERYSKAWKEIKGGSHNA
jgi:hypothetical protein